MTHPAVNSRRHLHGAGAQHHGSCGRLNRHLEKECRAATFQGVFIGWCTTSRACGRSLDGRSVVWCASGGRCRCRHSGHQQQFEPRLRGAAPNRTANPNDSKVAPSRVFQHAAFTAVPQFVIGNSLETPCASRSSECRSHDREDVPDHGASSGIRGGVQCLEHPAADDPTEATAARRSDRSPLRHPRDFEFAQAPFLVRIPDVYTVSSHAYTTVLVLAVLASGVLLAQDGPAGHFK